MREDHAQIRLAKLEVVDAVRLGEAPDDAGDVALGNGETRAAHVGRELGVGKRVAAADVRDERGQRGHPPA